MQVSYSCSLATKILKARFLFEMFHWCTNWLGSKWLYYTSVFSYECQTLPVSYWVLPYSSLELHISTASHSSLLQNGKLTFYWGLCFPPSVLVSSKPIALAKNNTAIYKTETMHNRSILCCEVGWARKRKSSLLLVKQNSPQKDREKDWKMYAVIPCYIPAGFFWP